MFWKRRKPSWFIDPSKVALGAVIENSSRNLSRTHVRVTSHRTSEVRFVAMPVFVRHCNEAIRCGGTLDIEQLLVAPILQRRYKVFFDRLTDWGPAARSAYTPRSERQSSVLSDA